MSLCSAFDYDTENMNSEDIYSSLKGVTDAIQNFSVRSQEDMNEPARRREGEEVGGAPGPWASSVFTHRELGVLNATVDGSQTGPRCASSHSETQVQR